MFPWTSKFGKKEALARAESLRPRTAKETAREMKALEKRSRAEKTFDDVMLSTENRLDKGHIAKTLAEASTPEGLLELDRVWRDLDAVMGPGKSVAHVLAARYPRLQGSVDRMTRLLRRGLKVRTEGPRKLILEKMELELKQFALLKSEILSAAEANVDAVKRKLQAEIEDEVFKKLVVLSPEEVKQECLAALEELEQRLRDFKKAAVKGVDTRPGTQALEKIAKEQTEALKAGKGVQRREELSSRIKNLAAFGDPATMGSEFAKTMKRKSGRYLSALEYLEDSDLVFQEALGVIAQAKTEKQKLLRRYVEQGAASLNAKELERIQGYLGQLRGLLPEAMSIRMKFLDGIFYKEAFEALDAFTPRQRGLMMVERVEGPLWVTAASGPPRQFGDGCLLLTGPDGQSAIVGLGEFKAGFDQDLLNQLFVRSDGRAVSATVQFIGADNQTHVRKLTREFAFKGGKKVALTRPPVYVYGRTGGESPETAALFKKMVQDEMQSGREMWKIQLPFSAQDNERFAETALKEAVRTLKKAKPQWGR